MFVERHAKAGEAPLKGADMAIWKATGRVTVTVERLPSEHEAEGLFALLPSEKKLAIFVAWFRLPENSGVPLRNVPMKADYPPVLIEVNTPFSMGKNEVEAERNLREEAAASSLAKAILHGMAHNGSCERLSNEARQEIEAYALAVEQSLRNARFVTSAAVNDFMMKASEPARELLTLVEEEPAMMQMLLALAEAPETPLDPQRYQHRRRECIAALRALADNQTAKRAFPKRRGRRTQATKDETASLAIMHRWWGYFGEEPSFAKASHFMRVAVPALQFYKVRKADPEQFLRETWAKQLRLLPLAPAT